jgi:hypothetical protein
MPAAAKKQRDSFRDDLDEFAGDYPASWRPSEGDALYGTLKRYEDVEGQFGPVVVAVIEDEDSGDEFSVWISTMTMARRAQATQR